MPDATIQLPSIADTTGPKVDSTQLTVGANTVQRERMNITDPVTVAGLASVLSTPPSGTEYGLVTRDLTNPTVLDLLQQLILEVRALKTAVVWSFNATGLGTTNMLDADDYRAEFFVDTRDFNKMTSS